MLQAVLPFVLLAQLNAAPPVPPPVPAPPAPPPAATEPAPAPSDNPPAAPAPPCASAPLAPPICPPCRCECGGAQPSLANAATAGVAQPPLPFIKRKGFTFAVGVGPTLMNDQLKKSSAAGLGVTGRFGYSFWGGRMGALLGLTIAGTGLEGGGNYRMSSLDLLGQYFLRNDWSLLFGIGAGGIQENRSGKTLVDDSAGGIEFGVAHDIWSSPSNNSLSIEARVEFLEARIKNAPDEPGVQQKYGATLLNLSAVFQWW